MRNLFKVIVSLAIVFTFVHPVWAVNTAVRDGNNITVVFDGATAMDFATDATLSLPNGAYYDKIEFKAVNANDAISMRERTASGIETYYFKSIDGGPQIIYPNKEFHRFYVVGNEATASVKLLMHIAQ